MQSRPFTPYLVLIGLMVITALALAFTVDVTLNDTAGILMDLPSAMDGGWSGNELRYSHDPEAPREQYRASELEIPDMDPISGDKLFTMSLAEYDALPHDTRFVKSIYTNEASDQVFVSIVLSGKERSSIHRPQRCLVGQGNTIEKTKYFKIPLEGRDPLKVCILETIKNYKDAEGNSQAYRGYYAYWFVGQQRETPSHYERMFWLAWDRVVHSVAHKWAYIAISGTREEDVTDAYKEEIEAFVQKLYPHLLIDLKDES